MTLVRGRNRINGSISVISVLFGLAQVLTLNSAHGFQRIQQTIELGPEIYQGSDATVLHPIVSVRASLATRYDIVEWFALVGRMTGQFFYSPTPGFNALTNSSYLGFGLGYNPCIRLKAGIEGVVPYIEFGGIASFNFVALQNVPANVSANQLALKLGYTAGLGLDWFSGSFNGNWGFGVGLNYFAILAGPTFLDFASGPIGASGFRGDLHIHLSL